MRSSEVASEAIENYLKAIYSLSRESPTGEAGMKAIATLTGVTVGTASTMVKRMAGAKLAKYERFGGVRLTARGERAAIDVQRRHRLIETFLVETLKLDWSIVHAEAERLEHAISSVVLEALDIHLHHPSVDPHGDPIPGPDGKIRTERGAALSTFAPGSKIRVARITDQGPAFLSFIAEHGLRPGTKAIVAATESAAQSITVHASGYAAVTMAVAAAESIICESA